MVRLRSGRSLIGQKTSMKKKNQAIETLRGLAIMLMVLGHVIGNTPDVGLMVENQHPLRWLYSLFASIRMPLFTVISGYVYAYRPVTRSSALSFFKAKLRRLIIPTAVASTIYYFLRIIIPGVNQAEAFSWNIFTIYIAPYMHFWYIHALLWIFIAIAIADSLQLLHSFSSWLIGFGITVILYFTPLPMPASMVGARLLAPFFLWGYGLNRYSDKFLSKKFAKICLISTLFIIGLEQMIWFSFIPNSFAFATILSLALGIVGCTTLFLYPFTSQPLANLGDYSYAIYIYHVLGTAGSRIVAKALGIHALPLLAILGLVGGIAFPILLRLASKHYPLLSLLLFGDKIQKGSFTQQAEEKASRAI